MFKGDKGRTSFQKKRFVALNDLYWDMHVLVISNSKESYLKIIQLKCWITRLVKVLKYIEKAQWKMWLDNMQTNSYKRFWPHLFLILNLWFKKEKTYKVYETNFSRLSPEEFSLLLIIEFK